MSFNASLGCVANVLGLIQSRVNTPDSSSYVIYVTDKDIMLTSSLNELFADDGSLGNLSYVTPVVMDFNNGRNIYPFTWIADEKRKFTLKSGPGVEVIAIARDEGYDFKHKGFVVILSSARIVKS